MVARIITIDGQNRNLIAKGTSCCYIQDTLQMADKRCLNWFYGSSAVADPGFPIGGGGAPSHWGALTSDMGTFQQKTYAKTKELDPVGGRAPAAAPGSANDLITNGRWEILDRLLGKLYMVAMEIIYKLTSSYPVPTVSYKVIVHSHNSYWIQRRS